MVDFCLKIFDKDGNSIKITPLIGSIITAGVVSNPTSLNVDNTYGFDIDLPGTSDIPFANLTVIALPKDWGWTGHVYTIAFGDPATYTINFYGLNTVTYYTMGAGGVMSSWAAGDLTAGDADTWDGLLNCWATAEWMLEDDDLYTSVRIFSGVANLIYDTSATTAITAYNLYGVPSTSYGVANVLMAVILKEWDY